MTKLLYDTSTSWLTKVEVCELNTALKWYSHEADSGGNPQGRTGGHGDGGIGVGGVGVGGGVGLGGTGGCCYGFG